MSWSFSDKSLSACRLWQFDSDNDRAYSVDSVSIPLDSERSRDGLCCELIYSSVQVFGRGCFPKGHYESIITATREAF